MAGSWRHIVNSKGKFVGTELLDDLGDAVEALEEAFGMVQFLAGKNPTVIEYARANYRRGLRGTVEPGHEIFASTDYTPEDTPTPGNLRDVVEAIGELSDNTYYDGLDGYVTISFHRGCVVVKFEADGDSDAGEVRYVLAPTLGDQSGDQL